MAVKYALISPTFGRPDEMRDFLLSLSRLDYDFSLVEVILADGTPNDALRPIMASTEADLPFRVQWIHRDFLPVSDARNAAAAAAAAAFLLFFDSDCLIPSDHLSKLDAALKTHPLDCFGGPDAAAPDFSVLQKAISYAMTSFLTTGGIRGKAKSTDVFTPRGFNMGFTTECFHALGGYDESFLCGEDIELSIRARQAGFSVGLIPTLAVFHKRRATLSQFHRQVERFGAARWALAQRHPGQLKPTHLFPAAFLLGIPVAGVLAVMGYAPLVWLYALYTAAVVVDAAWQSRDARVALLAPIAVFTMHLGYGKGFLKALLGR